MDPVINKYKSVNFGDLNVCPDIGLAYQNEMTVSVEYGKEYFDKYVGYENTEISNSINKGRIKLVKKYLSNSVLDIGIGSGEFIKRLDIKTYGYDINEIAIKWLKENEKFVDPYTDMSTVDGITLWDTMEHIPNPFELLRRVRVGQYVFISMPIFDNIWKVKESKHYKPNEHYYYFTAQGLIRYMEENCFTTVEVDDHETRSGRESILSFVFRKNLQYQ